ncbi:UDP-N-acetylmuramoyl-tripeptide--D-alanyl-D-alanine ligase [Pelotomaculum terephthalicicum JT]|uniref:UDP-N-acetylmuramoyl-tripeptide--D-alanyl-D- alanine ligase n=1 Tax=Pelotomaculum TaxID=191373 RepID=UPI0009C8D65D|nr:MULTISPECIES: UDP-N-acetylmuramoyl-tripeptide--D-alanyl-D-alanine ligase [Pelotomaculum]MCG9968083.1 UDP-N-acetylmuramoyl-tripeptide--D-alanyl-D-alanine ligase [Pelotomaculum terephthalicicum JT]OPX85618.1 MAG: UDP-N-acetylmuramoyl-tripeptide--D-alanyl-D-alanine ligase [Pelotomaculum sp. PtaB.Bin117]OPY64010.1 MAG: UDP-N-acetylmuramoyl-tripeptide--D-alanyl-D-alanine ligase [Pelotomaculum sp. PtaU1.Bin065]
MKATTLVEIAKAIGGEIIQGDSGVVFSQVSTDSRKIEPGSLFLALRGKKYDAHQFLDLAVAAGAGGLVVDRAVKVTAGLPVIKVFDTLAALQALAALNRDRCGIPLIAVTGSNGKTTTKDMIASVLGRRLRTVKTMGNYNNEIGLPLTLLHIDESSEVAVVEMGMRGPGEINTLCRIARPTGAVITNIGEAHLELLGTVSNIAAAKGEILENIPADGFAVLNADSPFIRREAGRCRGKVIFFGTDKECEIMVKDVRAEKGGNQFTAKISGREWGFSLSLPGRHNVLNALAAIAVGREFGFSIEEIAEGLNTVTLSDMRLEIIEAADVKIINDAYNASPASTGAALRVLKEVSGGRCTVAVLGNMLELGPRAVEGHVEVGSIAADLGVDSLVVVGDLASGIAEGAVRSGMPAGKIHSCANNQEAITVLNSILRKGDVVLVKGSRAMHMEQIVASISGAKPAHEYSRRLSCKDYGWHSLPRC